MAAIRLTDVCKEYDGSGALAVDGVDLEIADGEFMVLVGPSGCGKSTLLRMIAGLEDVTFGTIEIGERDVTDEEPRDRDVAMVFQNYALYPHLSVRENIGFGLKLRKMAKAEMNERVERVARSLGLTEYLDRKPAQLSGGQRQRVAMGRAMVRQPAAYLMDEPLSNLDAKLRVAMRAELARLHEQLGVTTVYVTHDQVEAMTLGSRVAVLRGGVLQQCDTPETLFERPANAFVAGFIGSPAMNLLEGTVAGDVVRFGAESLALAPEVGERVGERDVILGIRPTDFLLAGPDVDPALPRLRVVPDVVERLGSEIHIIFGIEATQLDLDGRGGLTGERDAQLLGDTRALLTARLEAGAPVAVGQPVELAVRRERIHFFTRDDGLRIETADPALTTA
ncbi:ABC transporter ATP-binding protein [Conexibacter woesei]|uniref:ABC transporter related protein n=1 Tax=Conexibacter woesei (strain DSM 14684 / CCUG 47730 / CIP 108061 / JCM 11494 / NBRC 100937 / ID131577) TaxID=469383 RepID=D3F538_CONWI|nr:sn-glycerol-3-phosphate ABC transporter ATP-binding protein UgpC [Conexibacter woesei]ADB48616.1 ABC transporter related protein [Conexibacter woesei DSM 14684]